MRREGRCFCEKRRNGANYLGICCAIFPLAGAFTESETSSDWLVHFNGDWRRHMPFDPVPDQPLGKKALQPYFALHDNLTEK